MSTTVAFVALGMTIAFVFLLASAVISAAWLNGTLKADLKFVKRYIAIHYRHMKIYLINH